MGQNRRYGMPADRAHGRREAAEAATYQPVLPRARHVWARLERAAGAVEHAGIVLGWHQELPAPAAGQRGWWAQVAHVDERGLHLSWLPAEQLRPAHDGSPFQFE